MKYEIDELDRAMIKLLSGDGRMSFTELSSRLNVTEKTVRARYKNLIENDILSVVGVVNPIALGLKAEAIIQMKIQSGMLQTAIEELKNIREIRFITMTSGDYPLLAQITVQNQDEITNILYKLDQIPCIKEYKSMIQLQVYKNTFEYI
ncbi:AsnC family transcriptional regulator [Heyndrickxia shackletonii]|uniref:AsnC family transcriptional regulator n=1 Tax=Heyndrickxia shackletonii TaxID=157838 RepID=A0A0Q3TEP2_9BACI|nr:Lrp/AsnC family transcriptional regulator [Heyndrickxia shackletonii]KQL52560.1 AsnC family transcriptional regulator [Heyndrickxia shackletonii]NEZ01138.1 Lrp/AsnC family transcriptional regulator [Heyndrickxia shackletonii]